MAGPSGNGCRRGAVVMSAVQLYPAPPWAIDMLRAALDGRATVEGVQFTGEAVADLDERWAVIRNLLHPHIVRAIEQGPEAYTPPRDGGDRSRSGADAAVCYALLEAGCQPDMIRAVYQSMPIGQFGKYADRSAGDRYLGVTIGKAQTYLADRPQRALAQARELLAALPARLREDPGAALTPESIGALAL